MPGQIGPNHTTYFGMIPVSDEHPKSLALSIDKRAKMFFVQADSSEGEQKWFSMETYDNVQ